LLLRFLLNAGQFLAVVGAQTERCERFFSRKKGGAVVGVLRVVGGEK